MSRSPTIILTRMESLLSKPERWTKGENARFLPDDDGEAPVHHDEASCFCLLGAKSRILGPGVPAGDVLNRDVRNRLASAAKTLFPTRTNGRESSGPLVASVNDHPDTTHADILDIVRLARAL